MKCYSIYIFLTSINTVLFNNNSNNNNDNNKVTEAAAPGPH